jgi:two-component system, NtrC family, sensor kinase
MGFLNVVRRVALGTGFNVHRLGVYCGINVGVALLYYGLAMVARNFASTPNSVTPVWPPDGLAVGAVMLYGVGVLPGVCFGSFLANVQAFLNFQTTETLLISSVGVVGIAVGTMVGTGLGTGVLRQRMRQCYPFNRVSDCLKFLIYAGLLGPVVNATVGVAMLVFAQKVPAAAYTSIWPVWWVSNVAGIFTLTPVILSANEWWHGQPSVTLVSRISSPTQVGQSLSMAQHQRAAQHWAKQQMGRSQAAVGVEAMVLAVAIALVGRAAFWGSYPVAYMLIPLLMWVAFRFGQLGATLATLLISTIALLGTVRGLGEFATADLNQSLMGLQSFIAVVVFTALIVAAVLAERARAEGRLRQAFSELQVANTALEQHTQELAQNNQRLEQTLQELHQTQAQMIQSEKMSVLGSLMAGIAHEINNPVGFLKGNIHHARAGVRDLLGLVDLYAQEYPQPNPVIAAEAEAMDLAFLRTDLPQLLQSMDQGVERIQGVSTSLRTFARLDRDQTVAFNLHEGLDSTLLILKHRLKAAGKRPTITVVTRYGDIPTVECYAGQINQVFMNLLANAIEALDEVAQNPARVAATESLRPQITLTTAWAVAGESVEIRVGDNGPGIPPAVQERIFENLFTTKAVGKGTGLGLAIAHQIVTENHHGSLRVSSPPGQGAEFILTLPLTPHPKHPSGDRQPPEQPTP